MSAEETLLEGLRARDARAIGQLYDLYQADINRIVWGCLGADQDHDDVVQRVFIAAIEGVHRVRDASAIRAWLRSVAVHTVRSELRRRRVRRIVSFSSPTIDLSAAENRSPEDRELLSSVYGVLKRMPIDERLVFVLRYVEELSLEEIAEARGISLATAKRRLRRASERFRRLAEKSPAIAARYGMPGGASPGGAPNE